MEMEDNSYPASGTIVITVWIVCSVCSWFGGDLIIENWGGLLPSLGSFESGPEEYYHVQLFFLGSRYLGLESFGLCRMRIFGFELFI